MSLTDYLIHAPAEQQPLLREQWKAVTETRTVRCPCGQLRALEKAYRCLYCGVWFCFPCAEAHFGQTHQTWLEEKRRERREKAAQEYQERNGWL